MCRNESKIRDFEMFDVALTAFSCTVRTFYDDFCLLPTVFCLRNI